MRTPTGSLFCTRCGSSAASCRCLLHFPPRAKLALHEAVLNEILEERVVSSRGRRVPRGVKRKMSNYPLRPRTPQPTTRVDVTVTIQIIKWTVLGLILLKLLRPRDRLIKIATKIVDHGRYVTFLA